MGADGGTRESIALTNLDQPLFAGAGVTKRDLVDYLDAVGERLVGVLAGRALSVVRVRGDQAPFMQKNLPAHAPEWIRTVDVWAQASRRTVRYAVCDDRRTLLWFANQRAVEYHPTLYRGHDADRPSHLVLDIDPPPGDSFGVAVQAARLVRQVLADAGMSGAVKTSGAKGLHVFVPLHAGEPDIPADPAAPDAPGAQGAPADSLADVAAATRAIAARAEQLDPDLATTAYIVADRHGKVFLDATRSGGATVVAAYSPRVRPGVPVSFPLAWADLDQVSPGDFTLRTAAAVLAGTDPWSELMPPPQRLDPGLVAQGHTIPVARVQAMHEGKRRARAARPPIRAAAENP